MKLKLKSIIALVALVLFSTTSWANEEFTFIYQLDGSASTESDAGTVTANISGSTATLTVTPKDGNYFETADITVYKTINGQYAQGRRRGANNLDTPIALTLQSADPEGETVFTFAVTDSYYDYEVTVNFKKLIDISGAEVTLDPWEFDYDGTAKEPDVETVVLNGTTISSEYYEVSYENNINAAGYEDENAPTVVVTAIKAPYKGVKRETFTINPMSADMKVTLGTTSYTYDGTAKEPEVTVTMDGATLTAGVDYKVEYGNNTDAGTATVTVTGINNFDGNLAMATFTIAKADITPTVTIDGWTYGEAAKEPSVTGNAGKGQVTYVYKQKDAEDTEYSADVPVNAGEYTVKATVAETDNYNGATATADFTIRQATLQAAYDTQEVEATLGETIALPQLTQVPQEQGLTTQWTSSNEKVATVDANGNVQIVGAGTAVITATIDAGKNYAATVTTSYTLTVKYGLWVNGIQVSEDNRKNVLNEEDAENASVKFDGKDILILNNCSTGSIVSTFDYKLTIFLKGENELTTIAVADTLVIDTEENEPGSLSLTAEEGKSVITGAAEIMMTGDLEWINGGADKDHGYIGVWLIPLGDGEEKDPDANYFVVEDGEVIFNKVIEDVLYTYHVNPSDDGDGNDGSGLVLNTQMKPDEIEAALKEQLGSDEFAEKFTGIAFVLPAGSGTIDFEVYLGSTMYVKIGNGTPIPVGPVEPAEGEEKSLVQIPYTCTEPTLVLVYNGVSEGDTQEVRGRAKVKTTTVKIYSFKVSARRSQSSSEPDEDAPEENILTEFNPNDYVDGVYTPSDSTLTGVADSLFLGHDVKCIDLSHTKIRNMMVKHGQGAFAGVDDQALIYMPVRNVVDDEEQNVVIGTVCQAVQLNFNNPFFRALKEFGVVDMTLDSSMDDTQSAAIYWPFSIPEFALNSIGDFYTVKGVDEDEVMMQKIEGDLAANTPCILVKKAEGSLALQYVMVEPVKQQAAGYLVGGYEMPYVTTTDSEPLYQFVATDGAEAQFIRVSQDDVKPFTAYLRATSNQEPQLAVRWTGDPLTGIRTLMTDTPEADAWHTLQGVKVEGTPKKAGIYLHHGKKAVVK